MAKKGQTFPYRIRFHYPASERSGGKEIHATNVISNKDELVREAREFLKRGASIELGSRQQDGKIHWFHSMTPADLPAEELVDA